MKTKKLRILSALLALAMLFALMPTAAFAEGESTYYTYQWNADHKVTFSYTLDSENNATITGAGADLPADGVVEIPEKIESYNVTAIGGSAFYRRTDLKEIDLKSATHLTSIGDDAFKFASALTTVTLPEASLQTIGGSAFNNCTALKSINIPSTVTAIGGWCFQDCYGLEEVTFAADSKLTTIQGGTFINCYGLKTITIPKSVKLIDRENSNGAFSGCRALESVIFETGSHLKTIEGSAFSYCSSLKTITIPQSVERIRTYTNFGAFSVCSGLESVIFEPGSGLTTVDSGAFGYNGNITFYYSDKDEKVKTALTSGGVSQDKIQFLTPTVTFEVDGNVFVKQNAKDNNFKAVEPENNPIKDGWNFVGWYTKDDNDKYELFDFNTPITDDITLYARWTASGTCGDNLTWTLDDNGTLTISGSGAMADYDSYYNQPWAGQRDNIKHLVVENGVTSIGNNAFRYCTNLIDADMSKALSLSSISTSFWGCTGLKNVVLNEGLKEIGGSAFSFCFGTSPGSINIPSTVTAIGSWCFQECSGLENVTFAGNSQLTKIEGGTFYWCESLKKITIPKSVKLIKDDNSNGAFESSGLESVIFEPGSGLEEVGLRAFNSGKNLTIYCSDEDTNVKEALKEKWNTGNIRSLTPTVTFEVDGTEVEKQDAKENHFKAVRPGNPTKKGYVFTGWYTKDADNEYKPFDFNTTVTENITLYAQWEELPDHQLTVIGGTFAVRDETIKTETKDDAVIANIPVDAEVTVAFNKEAYADSNQTFDGWVIEGLDDAENYTNQETFTFTMPQNGVRIEAMTKVVDADDSGWDAATVVTGAVIGTGTAILAYHIGMEVYAEQVLGKDVAVPRTRGEVALLAWQLAGSPEPNAAFELLTDEAKAQQWAVESGLLQPDAEGNFHAEKKLSKLKALRVLDAAKKQV